jgi:hypothetical protein
MMRTRSRLLATEVLDMPMEMDVANNGGEPR